MPKRGGRPGSAARRRNRADIRAARVQCRACARYADARADFHARRRARSGDCGDACRDAGVRALPADVNTNARADSDIRARAGYANPSADASDRRHADRDIRAGYANPCVGDIGSDARASARHRADCDIDLRAHRRACGHARARSNRDAGSPDIHADARADSDRDAHPADIDADSAAAHCAAGAARRQRQSGQRGGRASAGFHFRLRGRRVAHNCESVG